MGMGWRIRSQRLAAARTKKCKRAGIAVQEGLALDRADLAVAEETAQRHLAKPLVEHRRVVPRLAIEALQNALEQL